ncbi:MAG: hypothetical protein CM1200mP34_2400 [Verrucomicrobiales bacterium]|nr:MAG: hypothetical protein CM1200mP34_2400 [Verrucomicrobiales bacterium]
MENVPSQSAEDYLERILELIQQTGQARVVESPTHSTSARRRSQTWSKNSENWGSWSMKNTSAVWC